MIDLIAFDADDTLWHNERLFLNTQAKFKQMLANFHSEQWIGEKLYETESRNLQHFGYGVKGFTLSMIETAIELTESRISSAEIQTIIEWGKSMLQQPIELLDGVRETVVALAGRYPLMIITKGDLFDQESKIARSGIGDYFTRIEIVSEKDCSHYQQVLDKYSIDPARFIMIGNALKSDILPICDIGGRAIFVPYQTTWQRELVSDEEIAKRDFLRVESIREIPDLLTRIFATKNTE